MPSDTQGPDNITNPLSFPSPFDGLYSHSGSGMCLCLMSCAAAGTQPLSSSTKVGILLNIWSSRFLHRVIHQWGLCTMWSIAQLGMVPRNSFQKNNLCSTCNLKEICTWFEFCPSFTIPSVHHLTGYPAFSRAEILHLATYIQFCQFIEDKVVGAN